MFVIKFDYPNEDYVSYLIKNKTSMLKTGKVTSATLFNTEKEAKEVINDIIAILDTDITEVELKVVEVEQVTKWEEV